MNTFLSLFVILYNKARFLKIKLFRSYFKSVIRGDSKSMIFYGKSNPIFKGERNFVVGENVKFNEFCYLYARGNSRIVIGDNSNISSFAMLITSTYDLRRWINGDDIRLGVDIHLDKDINIGSRCWIGSGATILGGVSLSGHNVVVASGAVVTKSFSESYIVLGGVPARIIKNLDPNNAKDPLF